MNSNAHRKRVRKILRDGTRGMWDDMYVPGCLCARCIAKRVEWKRDLASPNDKSPRQ